MREQQVTRIAGAGLSGLATGIGLAQAGRAVEVFESGRDSGWEREGDWDAVENWTTESDFADLLDQWKVSQSFACRPVKSFEIYDPGGKCHSVSASRPILYLVNRGNQKGALEHALKEQALNCGVNIHYNERRSQQDVDVWAVGAEHRGQFLAAGLQFQTRHPDAVKLLIGTRHAPKAYVYLFIADGEGVLSVVLTRDFKNARAYLNRSLEFFQKVLPLDVRNMRMTSGFGGRLTHFWKGERVPLRVGEAAGFQDYLWGFGIRYALQSGILASQAIRQGANSDQINRSQIRPLVHASLFSRAVYDRVGDRTYRLMIEILSKSPRLVEQLRRYSRVWIPNSLLSLLKRVQPGV